jgi:hypothetical protein
VHQDDQPSLAVLDPAHPQSVNGYLAFLHYVSQRTAMGLRPQRRPGAHSASNYRRQLASIEIRTGRYVGAGGAYHQLTG